MVSSKTFFLIKMELLCNPTSGDFSKKVKLQDNEITRNDNDNVGLET